MKDLVTLMAMLFLAGLLVASIVLAVSLLGEPSRSKYIRQCIIDNKELPRPDLYCDALWQQSQYGNGGR